MTAPQSDHRLVIVGGDGGTNIGASFRRAAESLRVPVEFCDMRRAFEGPRAMARINWWMRGRRPTRLKEFSNDVVDVCRRFQPSLLIATGLAPLEQQSLRRIQASGVQTINYLTDDPWNPAFRSSWLLSSIQAYDQIFSVRRRNIDDLVNLGCPRVEYLPFAADPDLFYPQDPDPTEFESYRSDICFAGGADADRVPLIAALVAANFKVALYGDYWGRYRETRDVWRGHASPEALRKATRSAAVSLCLVRRANRDGHTMRSFEVPHSAGCMLAEDTDEHRALFGADDHAVRYFRTIEDLVASTAALLGDPDTRRRLADTSHGLIVQGRHTYQDRLSLMLARARIAAHVA